MTGKKGKLSTAPYKGVRDFYPEDQAVQDYLFATMRETVERFGYAEYAASILEPSELYKGKGAENEELVNEQTYTFLDRGGREVTLRPEMTPTVSRMVAGRRRELTFPLRWYSIPNLFRYERPQRGRLREHYQLNVDIFGVDSLFAEVEIIAVAHAVMTSFGATSQDFEIRINSRTALDELFTSHGFPPEQAKQVRGLIDRKDKMKPEAFEKELAKVAGPNFRLPDTEPRDVAGVRKLLADIGVRNTVWDGSIVRGFDYYTGVVFEVFDTSPENNRALFGGGRYDNLLSLFGTASMSAVGFGMGDVTMRDFLESRGRLPEYLSSTILSIATVDEASIPYAMSLAEEFRRNGINTVVNLTDRGVGDQIRTADRMKVPFILVVGDAEIASGVFNVKNLATGAQTTISRSEVSEFFSKLDLT